MLIFDGADRGNRSGMLESWGAGTRNSPIGYPNGAVRERIVSEMKLLIEHGVSHVGGLHVLSAKRDGDIKIQIKAKDGTSDENEEDSEGSIFKVGDLNFHGSEFNPPAGVFIVRGRFEAHVLPVGGLKVFEMIGFVQI